MKKEYRLQKHKQKSALYSERGFTVIEIAFASSLAVIIMLALYITMSVGKQQAEDHQYRMTVHENAQRGVFRMEQELRLTAPDQVTIGGGNNSITFFVPDPSDSIDTDYSVKWASAHEIQYAISGTQLIRTDLDTSSTSVLANDVTAVSFTGDVSPNPEIITISLSVQKTLSDGRMIPVSPLQIVGQAEVRNG